MTNPPKQLRRYRVFGSLRSSMIRSSTAGGVASLFEWGRLERGSKAEGPSARFRATRVETQAGETPYFEAVARTPRPWNTTDSTMIWFLTTTHPPKEVFTMSRQIRSLCSEVSHRWDCELT